MKHTFTAEPVDCHCAPRMWSCEPWKASFTSTLLNHRTLKNKTLTQRTRGPQHTQDILPWSTKAEPPPGSPQSSPTWKPAAPCSYKMQSQIQNSVPQSSACSSVPKGRTENIPIVAENSYLEAAKTAEITVITVNFLRDFSFWIKTYIFPKVRNYISLKFIYSRIQTFPYFGETFPHNKSKSVTLMFIEWECIF